MAGKKEIVTTNQTMKNELSLTINQQMIDALKTRYEMLRKLQKDVLEENVDYGYPAGKRDYSQKPSLYKSGAEKLTQLFNLVVDFHEVEAIENEKEVRYKFRCELRTVDGRLVGVGYGMASSFEKQHWKQNPLGNANTILKIAKKRSHVDAVLTGLGASNVFTQDIEDYEPEQLSSQQEASAKQKELLAVLIGKFSKSYNLKIPEVEGKLQQLTKKKLEELTKEEMSALINFLSIVKLREHKLVYATLMNLIEKHGFWSVILSLNKYMEDLVHGKITLLEFKRQVIFMFGGDEDGDDVRI